MSVEWSSLNANYLRNMPRPQPFPIASCSIDPSFYTTIIPTYETCDARDIGCGRFTITHQNLLFETKNPFGTLYGFMTDVGVLPVPTFPVHGFLCDAEMGVWVIGARRG